MVKALKPYWFLLLMVTLLSVAVNLVSIYFPKEIGKFIDAYSAGTFSMSNAWFVLGGLSGIILVLSLVLSALGAYASEKVAFDLRNTIISSLKGRSFRYTRETTSSHLITLTTSDVDAVKGLITDGIPSILMSIVTLLGAIYFLISIDWKLALMTLSVIPFIIVIFAVVFGKVGPLFEGIQQNMDKINKVINESIIASSLVRVLNAGRTEEKKFEIVNRQGTDISMKLTVFFAALIPIITLLSSAAVLVVLWFGGKFVVSGDLTIGEMSAFLAYTSVFVWPFFVLSFSGTMVSKAAVSLKRIYEVIDAEEPVQTASVDHLNFVGNFVFKNVSLKYKDKNILKDISFEIKPGTRTAIIGPTGAGKTELLNLMTGLISPTSGEILIDGRKINEWDQHEFLSNIGMVFQDSIVFNTDFKENVLFDSDADEKMFNKAVETADLSGLMKELPKGVATDISERGTTLSGGQKQRLMLARALAINPKILLLDDFTARVDAGTEERILENIKNNFRGITLVSVTQKIEPIKDYDHIILLMEGEILDQGKHQELISRSIEYQQIYESQWTTN